MKYLFMSSIFIVVFRSSTSPKYSQEERKSKNPSNRLTVVEFSTGNVVTHFGAVELFQ